MLISCWCWWWTAGWSCYCCWFLRGRDCSSSCRLGGEWTLTEWTRLSAPLSSGLSTHSLLLRPGCWPRWSSGHSVIFIQIWHFCICIRVHIHCTCLHVLPLPPSTCWLLTLLLFIVSTLQSFGLCFDNLWIRSSGNKFLFINSNWIHILYGRVSPDQESSKKL